MEGNVTAGGKLFTKEWYLISRPAIQKQQHITYKLKNFIFNILSAFVFTPHKIEL